MAEAIRQLGISEVAFYRWRKGYGGLSGDQLGRLEQLEKENEWLRRTVADLTLDKQTPAHAAPGKLLSPSRHHQCIQRVRSRLGISEWRASRLLGQCRSTQYYFPRGRDEENRLVADMSELACRYGWRIAALLRKAGWEIIDMRVERL